MQVLGCAHIGLGKFQSAQKLLRDAVALAELRLKLGDPELETLVANAATAYGALEKFETAGQMLRRAHQALGAASGQEGARDHKLTLGFIHSFYGTVLAASGDAENALRNLKSALHEKIRELGRDHPEVAKTSCNIGAALALLGRKEEATAQLRLAKESQERCTGHASQSSFAITLFNLSFAAAEAADGPLRATALKIFQEMGHVYAQHVELVVDAPLFDWT